MQDTIKNFKSKLFFISFSHSFEFSLYIHPKTMIKLLNINLLNRKQHKKLKLVNIINFSFNHCEKEIITPNN